MNTIQESLNYSFTQYADRVAITCEDNNITFSDLNKSSNYIANLLFDSGYTKGDLIGVLADRKENTISIILGILKAGCIFVPLDSNLPIERIKDLIKCTDLSLIITDEDFETKSLLKFTEIKDLVNTKKYTLELNNKKSFSNNVEYEENDPVYIYFTSGTSGKPKAFLGKNKSLLHFIKWEIKEFNIDKDYRISQLTSIGFDAFLRDMFLPLMVGGTIVILKSKDKLLDSFSLINWIEKHAIKLIHCVPSVFKIISLGNLEKTYFKSLKYILMAGEEIHPESLKSWFSIYGRKVQLINMYGTSETTMAKTFYYITESDLEKNRIPVGKAIPGSQVLVLDKFMKPCPKLVEGEIYIRTPYRTYGYCNMIDKTDNIFVKNPFTNNPDDILHKTGDSGKLLMDSNIEYIGRNDDFVKIRGNRVSLGEIENCLLKLDEVKDVVVMTKLDSENNNYLIGYVIPDDKYDSKQYRNYLLNKLPDYMIPNNWVEMESFPLTQNGKVNLEAFPEESFQNIMEYEAPQSELEKLIAIAWGNLLGINIDQVSIKDDFFLVGGNSLKLVSLISKLHKLAGVLIPIEYIFNNPTIENIADFITENKEGGYDDIRCVEKKKHYHLSSAQKRLFLLQQMDLGSTAYNMQYLIPLGKEANKEKIEQIFLQLIERHESFRTSFEIEGKEPVQQIHEQVDFKLEEFKIERNEEQNQRQQFIQTFDLSQAPLLRAAIVEIKGSDSLLMIDMHHIISDKTSQIILEKEFQTLYIGEELTPLSLQYKDYSEWQNSKEQQKKLENQEDYWKGRFEGEIPVLNLPTDYPRPAIKNHDGARVFFALSKEETLHIKSFAKENGITLYMSLLSAFNILLSKLSGQENIIVGTPLEGRRHVDLESIVGMFVNTLVIRNEVNGSNTLREFIGSIKQTTIEAYENQEYQFEDLVEQLSVNRDTSRNPVFDVMFNLLNQAEYSGDLSAFNNSKLIHSQKVSKFDLTLTALDYGEYLMFSFEYCTQLFKAETIDRFIEFLKKIVNQIARKPELKISAIDILSEAEKQQLLYEFNETETEYPKDKTIHRLFEEQVLKNPDCISVLSGDVCISYNELNIRSNQLAWQLKELGVEIGDVVGLNTDRTEDLLIGILGILKCGAAYLPLNSSWPKERINFMLSDSHCKILVHGETINKKEFNCDLLDISNQDLLKKPKKNLELAIKSSNTIYIIYTSGTTGNPKGVLTTHKNVSRVVLDNEYISINSRDKILQLSSYTFDGSVFDIYGALLNGSGLVMINNDDLLDIGLLLDIISKKQISIFFLTTALFNTIVDYGMSKLKAVRKILFGGERISVQHTEKALKELGEGRLIHVYGPTETTVFASYHNINTIDKERETIPIGTPLSNTSIYLFDSRKQLVPKGVSGEIYIGGYGNAQGYLNNVELTNDKFVTNPFNTKDILYRTGDLARFLPNGSIEFLGRIDHQVKIRGFRIELGEIESTLLKHENINESIVLAIEKNNEKYLCAYVVCKEEISHEELRAYMSAQLPDYMIPSYFVQLEILPLTSNGKVNRKVLPLPEVKAGDDYVAPSNEIEEKLVEIWSEVLNIPEEEISVTKDFFAIGGHSLKATILAGKIHKELGVEFPLRDVFLHSNIQAQASQIKTSDKKDFVSIPKAKDQEYYPLSSAQKRMYLLQELEQESTAYNMPYIIPLGAEADKEKIEEAFRQLIKRHESFRTSFEIKGEEPVQRIHEEVEFTVEEYTITKEEVQQKRNQFIQTFDLSKAPLIRVSKVNVKGEGSLLMIDMHHIISDGTSFKILEQDFYKILEGKDLEPLQIHYKDFSEWQNSYEQQERIKGQESYWLDKYSGEIPVLDLPTDYPRPAIQEYEGASLRFVLSKEQTENIRAFTKENDITLYMTVLSIFTLLLSKLSEQDDIIVGSPIVDRKHSDLENIVGLFLNTLAIRNEVKENNTVKEFVATIKQNVLDAFENQEYQFEELVEKISIGRDLSRNPLIDVMFNLLNHTDFSENQETEDTKNKYTEKKVKFDLYLRGWEQTSNIVLVFEFRKKLFNKETISKFIDYFKILTDQVVLNQQKKISSISLLSLEDRKIKLEKFNKSLVDPEIEKITIQEILERSFKNNPDKIVIKDKNGAISYKELQNRYMAIAMHISNMGIKEGSLIGVYSSDRIEVISTILGIIHARCVFVPLDANFPINRIMSMVEQVQLNWIISGKGMDLALQQTKNNPADTQIINLNNEIYDTNWKGGLKLEYLPSDPLYIYYTSGSTGKPKAILGKNNSLVHFIKWEISEFSINHAFNFSQLTNPGFDVFLRDIFAPLVAGASIHIPNEEILLNGEKLIDWIEKSDVTLMHCVPSVFRQMNKVELNRGRINGLKYILLAGEKIIPFELKKWYEIFKEQIQLVNIYGPTETTLAKSSYRIKTDDISRQHIPIKPINGSRFIVLDKHKNICPIGIPGEIYIRTPYRTLGYYDAEGINPRSFIQNPFSENVDDLVYKTGDIGKEVKGGCIELLGRYDNQVKIRGLRIELGEIENNLLKHQNVKESIIIVKGKGDDSYLCAYVVLGQKEQKNEFRTYLTDLLPDYMIPSYFIELEQLPLNSNGKVDRKALPAPEIKAGKDYEAPQNLIETKLVEIWSEVLNISKEKISTTVDFFSIGGHSLKATILAGRIHKELEIEFPLRDVFVYSNIQKQAKQIKLKDKKEFISIQKAQEQDTYIVSSAQKRMYLLQQMDLDSTAYNMQYVIPLGKEANKEKIEEVFKQLILRHESFRTSFAIEGKEPVQQIHEQVDFKVEHFSVERDEIHNQRQQFIKAFDLSKAPLLRVAIVEIKEEYSLLMIDMHHIISDGVSRSVLERDFQRLYLGENLPELKLQYKDYSEWQNSEEQKAKVKDQEAYWINEFKGEIPILNLPLDNVRPSTLGNEGNMLTVVLSPEQTQFIRTLCSETGTTIYMSMMSIFSILLSKLSGQDNFVVGQSIAGRNHPDLQKIVGMFVNSLPIKVNPHKNKSFNDLLSNIKETTLKAFENQEYQFDELVNKLNIQRDAGRNPIFDVMVNMFDIGENKHQFENIDEYQIKENIGRRFDLTLNITNSKNGIVLGFQYYPRIFNSETIIKIAQYFKNIIAQLEEKQNLKISEIELLTKSEKENVQNKLGEKRINRKTKLPISFHQERIWFIDEFEKNNLYKFSPVYHNIPFILEIEGIVDVKLLNQSIQYIISRHDILRSKFSLDDEKIYHQVLDKENFLIKELTINESQKSKLVKNEIDVPFDLEKDSLFRAALLKESENIQTLLLVAHHIISDKYSLQLLAKEIMESYHALHANKSLNHSELPIQFADYIYWQKETYPIIKDHLLSYWKPQLNGELQALKLPEDTKRAAIHIYNAGEYNFELPESLTEGIYEYANLHNYSIDVVLLGFYKILLGKYANQKEILVGTSVNGRNNKLTKDLVGPVSNLIVLRSIIDFEEDFTTFISQLDKTIKESLDYKDIPFDQLVSEINPAKDMSRTALFDILFQYEENIEEFASESEMKINHIPSNLGFGKYDQNLLFQKNRNTLKALFVYNTEYFRKETIIRFFDHYIQLITNTLKQADQKLSNIGIITEHEKQELLYEFNDTKADYPKDKTIHQLFEEQVNRTPENIAVKIEGETLTYSKLNEKANKIANTLREDGICRDDVVAIFLDRSMETVFTMLGVLKSGGAYLPIDPDYPKDRIEFILTDSKAKTVITTKKLSDRIEFEGNIVCVEEALKFAKRASNIETINTPSDLSYIIYTSGTTGKPKGVMVEHRNVARLFFNDKFQFEFSEKDVWTMFHSHCFDFSVWEMYGALLYGGKLIIIPKDIARDVVEYYNVLSQEKVTVLNQTPSAFYNLAEVTLSKPENSLENLRYVIFGGEALKPGKLKEWFNVYSNVKLINMFGITETTVHVTYKEIGKNEIENDISNIGTSIPTLTTYVVDSDLRLVPKGLSGELLVGGEGVSRGYLGREDLTRERFIQNPYNSEERLYRSGDLVKLLANGEMEYLGRIDDQVQLRGFRIELGEIESTINKLDNIKDAVVIDRQEKNGDKYLCAYIVCKSRINQEEIRTYLSTSLPDYMVPSYFVELDKIPLTSNGKVNRKELPKPEIKAGNNYVAPSNEVEEKLAEIWSRILNIPSNEISVEADFFELGGHSLKVLNVVSAIKAEFGVALPLMHIYKASNIHAMSNDIMSKEFVMADYEVYNDEDKENVFCFPPMIGYGLCFAEVARLIPEYCFHAFNYVESDELVNFYANRIEEVDNKNPYILMGYSSGCRLVSLVARELEQRGYVVSDVILIDGVWNEKDLEKAKKMEKEEIEREIDAFINSTHEQMKKMNMDFLIDQVRSKIIGYSSFIRNIKKFEIIDTNIHFIHSQWQEDTRKEKLEKVLSMKEYTRKHFSLYQGSGSHIEMLFPNHIENNVKIISDILKKK